MGLKGTKVGEHGSSGKMPGKGPLGSPPPGMGKNPAGVDKTRSIDPTRHAGGFAHGGTAGGKGGSNDNFGKAKNYSRRPNG